MIKSIKLENFFSFKSPETIKIYDQTNILLGINGSGKSNFLKAIRFLYESIAGNGLERIFLKEWGGFDSVANFSSEQASRFTITYEFDKDVLNKIINTTKKYNFPSNPFYELTIHKQGLRSYKIQEGLHLINEGDKIDFTVLLALIDNKGALSELTDKGLENRNILEPEIGLTFKEQEPLLRQISDPERFLPQYALKTAIESISVYDYFDTTLKSSVRQPASFGIEVKLLPTGENLVQLLQRLKTNHSLQYEKIETLLKNVNPSFKAIDFDIIGSKFMLALRETNLTKTIGVEHISDGTLRFLLLLSILYNPERGKLICLDEPEIGLHPDMINTIAEAIKYAAKTSQIILATHSPLLLNAFDIEDCMIFEKNEVNESYVIRLTENDFTEDSISLLPGQLWLEGKIGAKRW